MTGAPEKQTEETSITELHGEVDAAFENVREGELDGVRLMSEERVKTMSERQTHRPDRIIRVPVGYAMGFMTGGNEGWPQGPRVTAFGHAGFGGSIGFCDPKIGMSFGFTTNALAMDLIGYGRTAGLADAARKSAEALA